MVLRKPGVGVSRPASNTMVLQKATVTPSESASLSSSPHQSQQEHHDEDRGKEGAADVNLLARQVWSILRHRIKIDSQRLGSL